MLNVGPSRALTTKPLQRRRHQPIRAAITGVHGYLPPDVLTNAELAQMVDTTDAWIIERTGIKERHILKGKGLGTSHMGAEAVRGLLEKTGTAPDEVDLLICATTTPDFVFPSTANSICDMVGIRNIGSLRRAGGMLRLHLCADHRIAVHRDRQRAARSSWSAPTRCRRSSTTPTARPACCSATAPAPC